MSTPRTYGNWQKPTSPGLFGLGSLGTALMLGGLMLVILVVMVGGLLEAALTFLVLAAALATVVTRDRHGRSVIERASARISWLNTQAKGAHLYRSGPLGFCPWGTHQLPGLAAQLRLTEHLDAYGQPFALVHCPSTNTYAAVLNAEPDGASLVDRDQVDSWVSDWGDWLAMLADEPGVQAAAVTIETAPDTGHRLRTEVSQNLDPQAPAFAREMLEEVVIRYPEGSSVIKAYVTITFSATAMATGKTRTAHEVGRDLSARLPGLTSALAGAGAGAARPLPSAELCAVIRTAYNPGVAHLISEAGSDNGLDWSDVGPTAAEAAWGSYRHDDAHSMTWMMSRAPRGNVQSSVLHRLLAPHRDIDRKRVTLLYRPINPARAASIVEADLRSAEFLATSKAKPTARSLLATRAASSTASEEASGAALVNFAMLVTATVFNPAGLPEAAAAVDNLAATARLQLRLMQGAQDSAFACALPLGLVIPRHLKIPSSLKDRI
ncbi:MAG: SCO6880 family protein [Angustibacter sp.]